jgi:hypothetical protein
MKQPQRMTRKDALNILYDLRDAYIEELIRAAHRRERGYEEWKKADDETWQALMKVTEAVYGPCRSPQCPFPCDVCRHRYAEHDVQEKGKVGKTWCCTPCLEQLRVEKELTDIDGEPVKPEGEVQA